MRDDALENMNTVVTRRSVQKSVTGALALYQGQRVMEGRRELQENSQM